MSSQGPGRLFRRATGQGLEVSIEGQDPVPVVGSRGDGRRPSTELSRQVFLGSLGCGREVGDVRDGSGRSEGGRVPLHSWGTDDVGLESWRGLSTTPVPLGRQVTSPSPSPLSVYRKVNRTG